MERLIQFYKLAILLFFLSTSNLISFAQKYSNEFLSIGVGARAQALGNAVVASVNDVTAGVWNPAGLAAFSTDQGLQLGAMHAEWFGGFGKFDYLGVTLPLANRERRIGISLVRFGIDEINNTLSLYEEDGTVNFDNLKQFSAADYAFMLSYGQPLKTKSGKLLVGGNVKVVHRRIGPFATSWGFGLDLGLQYLVKKWQLGLMLKDISTTFNAWSFTFTEQEKATLELTNNEIPINSVETTKPQIILGVSRYFDLNKIGIQPELDLLITTDGQRNTLISSDPFSIDPGVGIETNYNKFIFLRFGVNQFQEIKDFDDKETLKVRPSLGLGLKISSLRVDYAFTDLGSNLGSTFSHIVSLQLDFKPRNVKRGF